MKRRISLVFFSSFVFLISSCSFNTEKDPQEARMNSNELKKRLLNVNKIVVEKESERINEYIKLHKWNMQSTGTGLRYMIYENGNGQKTVPGNTITMRLNVELLDSTLCYSPENSDPVVFVINQSEQIRGLHELALLLKKGDKAKAILPPHLAYGLPGDNNKIPSKAVLVCDVEVLNVK